MTDGDRPTLFPYWQYVRRAGGAGSSDVGAALVAARPNPVAGTSPAPTVLRVSFRLLNNVGADAHIGPLIRPQIDRGRVWAPAPTALQ